MFRIRIRRLILFSFSLSTPNSYGFRMRGRCKAASQYDIATNQCTVVEHTGKKTLLIQSHHGLQNSSTFSNCLTSRQATKLTVIMMKIRHASMRAIVQTATTNYGFCRSFLYAKMYTKRLSMMQHYMQAMVAILQCKRSNSSLSQSPDIFSQSNGIFDKSG